MLSTYGKAIIAAIAVLVGGGVAAWQSQLSATYGAVAAIPVRADSGGAELRRALHEASPSAAWVGGLPFRLVPTETDLYAMQRARPAHAGRAPEFVDTNRQGVFHKFRPPQRQIHVTAYGSTPRAAARNAVYYASRWVDARRQRLAALEEAVDAEVARQVAAGTLSASQAEHSRDLAASLGKREAARFGKPRLARVNSSPTSPRPLRDGVATAAAIFLVILGVASVTGRSGSSRARARPAPRAATES
jgi:hypothetical protein